MTNAGLRYIFLTTAAVLFLIAGLISGTSSTWTHLIGIGLAFAMAGLIVEKWSD